MKRISLLFIGTVAVSGCAGMQVAHTTQCESMGYRPGTELYLDCLRLKQDAHAQEVGAMLDNIRTMQTMRGQRIIIHHGGY